VAGSGAVWTVAPPFSTIGAVSATGSATTAGVGSGSAVGTGGGVGAATGAVAGTGGGVMAAKVVPPSRLMSFAPGNGRVSSRVRPSRATAVPMWAAGMVPSARK
jgi:hypothetical protein